MPKLKTNKQAAKKVRVSASGRMKRAQAFTNHNTAKKTPKRRRQLRGTVAVDSANKNDLARMLPYNGVK